MFDLFVVAQASDHMYMKDMSFAYMYNNDTSSLISGTTVFSQRLFIMLLLQTSDSLRNHLHVRHHEQCNDRRLENSY